MDEKPSEPPSRPVYPMTDFRGRGVLWMLNRVVFHPRGFAIGLHWADDVTVEQIEANEVEPIGFSIQGDGKEVWAFGQEPDWSEDAPFAVFEAMLDEARQAPWPPPPAPVESAPVPPVDPIQPTPAPPPGNGQDQSPVLPPE